MADPALINLGIVPLNPAGALLILIGAAILLTAGRIAVTDWIHNHA